MSLDSSDPSDIANASRCFASCVPVGEQQALRTYLLTQLGNVATPPCVTPTAPTSAGAKSVGNTTILMSWSQPPNAGSFIKNYIVYWGTVSGVYTNNSGLLPAMPRLYTISGLSTGTTYFWAVQAVAFSGCNSGVSSEKSATTTGAAPACTSPVLTDWLARVAVNGGAVPSAATQQAVCAFANGLVTDGLDALMISWNAFVADSLTAALTPQLVGGGVDPWTNHNFVAGDLTINGLAGDAATKYLDTGVMPSADYTDTVHAGITAYISATGAGGFLSGCDDGTNNKFIGLTESGFYAWTFASGISGPNPGWAGYVSGNVTAGGAGAVYKANSTTPHASFAAGPLGAGAVTVPPYAFPVFCFRNNTGALVFSGQRLSFLAITRGLNSAQSALFSARAQALRVALGGGFV